MKTYIFDIDGTLADCSHRVEFLINHKGERDDNFWHKFYSTMSEDKAIEETIEIHNSLLHRGFNIIYITGRNEEWREETLKWLYNNIYSGLVEHLSEEVEEILLNHLDNSLYMRPKGSREDDTTLKPKIIEGILKDNPYMKIMGMFEDRKRVVDSVRKMGIRVYHVDEGNF